MPDPATLHPDPGLTPFVRLFRLFWMTPFVLFCFRFFSFFRFPFLSEHVAALPLYMLGILWQNPTGGFP